VVAILLLVFSAAVAICLLGPRNSLSARGSAALPMRSLGDKPILQLELVRSERDIVMILAPEGAERDKILTAARAGNVIDSWLFIPSYSLLLLVLALLGTRDRERSMAVVFTVLAVAIGITAVADWAENWGIHRTLQHLEGKG